MAKLIDIIGKCISGEWGFEDNDGTGIPVLRTTNFTNDGIVNYSNVVTRQINKKNLQEKYLKKGDIIVEKSGGSDNQPVGRVVYFEGEENTYLFNNFTGLLRVFDQRKWHPKYVFYALFANYQNGGTRSFENKTTGLHNLKTDSYVSSMEINEVSFDNQTQIVRNLDKIINLISLRKQQLSKLDEVVKSRFIELFGDPIANQFGWDTTNIGAIVTEVRYGTSRPAVENGKYPYLRMNNLTFDGHLDLKDLKRIDIPEEEIEKCIVRKGDVLFNRTNSVELVGKTCVFDLDEEMVIAGYIIRVRLGQKMIPTVFSAFMNSQPIKELLRGMAKGAVNQANINAQELQSIRIYLPPIDLQEQFATFVEQTDKSKLVIQKSLEKLEILKKALMQKHFG